MKLTLRAAFGVISRLPKAEECDLRESLTEPKKSVNNILRHDGASSMGGQN